MTTSIATHADVDTDRIADIAREVERACQQGAVLSYEYRERCETDEDPKRVFVIKYIPTREDA